MEIETILSPEQICIELKVANKKQALSEISRFISSHIGISNRDIFDMLLQRERLGSTGTGKGIAIPHGRLNNIDRLYAYFIKLESPIDFEAIDDQPVDLIVVLLAPETSGADHLKALAKFARILRSETIVASLRGVESEDSAYSILIEDVASDAA